MRGLNLWGLQFWGLHWQALCTDLRLGTTQSVLRRMRHQEHWQAVGAHHGPTRIYGPTVRAMGGTAQLALRSSSAAAIIAGPRHSQ